MNGYNTYIGARYVPIIMGAWSSSVAYEPLSIVTYEGNSYTSRTYVPAGTPVSNETFWALTGDYNAQVEQYRQEVEQYKNTVDGFQSQIEENTTSINSLNLSGKNCHFFGDSLTYGTLPNGGGQSTSNFPKVFGEITGANVFNHSVPGATCAEISTQWNWIYSQINNADLSQADYIFIMIGTNDYGRNYSIGDSKSSRRYFAGAYYQSLQLASTKAKPSTVIICMTLLPNAAYFTGKTNTLNLRVQDYDKAIIDVCNQCNVQLIDMSSTSGINYFNYTTLLPDSTHLTDSAYANVGRALVQAMSSGYSMRDIYSGENIIIPDSFINSPTFTTNFPNGTNGVCVDLTKGNSETPFALYNFAEDEVYTVSYDIYNENNVDNTANTLTVQINLVYDLRGEDQDIVNISTVAKPKVGITHVCSTFRINTSRQYSIYLAKSTNISALEPIGIANLTIVRGEHELKAINMVKNYADVNEWAEGITSSKPIKFAIKDGICMLSCDFTTTSELTSGTLIATLPTQMPVPLMAKADQYSVLAYSPNTSNVYALAVDVSAGKITAYSTIPASTRLMVSTVFPAYY